MLRFTCFGFPVEIRWPFWLVTAILGGAMDTHGTVGMRLLLIWVGVVFVSILAHELGHALAMRHFGDSRAEITLYEMGGYARGTRWLSRFEDIAVSAAGPVASLLLAALGWLVGAALGIERGYLGAALAMWTHVNLFWTLLNILPIIPLDGGRISAALYGQDRERQALRLSFYFAVGVAIVFGGFSHSLWTAMFFGMLAYNNWQQMNHGGQIRWMR